MYIDTGGFIALVDERDSYHQDAKSFYMSLPRSVKLITSILVISETYTWLRYHADHDMATRFLTIIDRAEKDNSLKVVVTDNDIKNKTHAVQQINGNAFNKAIYDVFLENKGSKTEAPAKYSWMVDIDTVGGYYKYGQYDFLDQSGSGLQRFDIYSLIESHPAEILAKYPKFLLHDATANQWYLFNNTAGQSINQLIDTANKNGFLKVISSTVV
jgi:uncharacterized protein with PIN domain